MTTAVEASSEQAVERGGRRTAFGLALDLDPRIGIDGLSATAGPPASGPPTGVRLDPEGVGRRWSRLREAPERVAWLRAGGSQLLTIDFARPAGYLLWASGCGRVLISPDGWELLCDPQHGSGDCARILTAQALPLAATLRGLEVLHASGVVLGGKAVLIAGGPGAGKSSLAAALLLHGARLLSDDVVALEHRAGSLTAHAGSQALRLRPSECDRLSRAELDALGRRVPAPSRQLFLPDDPVGAAPFGQLFLLERSQVEPAIELLDPVEPAALLATSFNLSVRTPERLTRHLDLAAALAATGRVHRLRVQPGVDAARLGGLLAAYLATRQL